MLVGHNYLDIKLLLSYIQLSGPDVSKMMNTHRFILLLIILSLGSSLIPVHRTPYDYGYLSYTVERALNGEILYRDFVNHFAPGHIYGPALFYSVFGVTTYSLILYWAFFNVLTCITLLHISRHLSNTKFLFYFLPVMYIFFVQPSLYVSSDRLFFPILTILLILNYYERRKEFWLYLSGLSLGGAYLFSHEVAVLATCSLILFIFIRNGFRHGRPVFASATLIGGAVAMAAPVYLHFLMRANLSDMVYWLLWEPLVAYREYASIPLSGYFTHRSLQKLAEGFPLYLEILVYVSFIVYFVYRRIALKSFSSRNLNLLLILLLGIFLFQTATVRSDHTHFMFAVLPAFILFSVSVEKAMELLKQTYFFGRMTAFVKATVFILMTIGLGAYGEYEWVLYLHKPADYVWLQSGRGRILTHKEWADDLNGVVRYVVENTGDSDYIFVIPVEAYVYFLSGRRNPTKNDYYQKCELTLEKQVEAVKDLHEKKPKLVVFGGIYQSEFIECNRVIVSAIDDRYQLARRIGKYEVLTLK